MKLYKKLLKRIEDGNPIYCNETFAKDLEAIANNHFEQCNIHSVVVPKGTLVCKDDKKSICNNPMSHECCNKHHKRL